MQTKTPQTRVLYQSILRAGALGLFVFLLLTAITPLSNFFIQSTAVAATPTLNFQARLESSTGAIAPDGNYNVQFKLYEGGTTSGGGTNVWTETRLNSATQGVRVANGYLTVNLGDITSFPGTINWDADLFLSMNIGGTTTGVPAWDGEMTPYLKLTSVPYAFQAQRAEQLSQLQGANTGTLNFDTLTADQDILLPNESGILCIQNSSNCGFLTGSAANGAYIQLQTTTPGTVQTGNFNIDGTGIAGVLQAGRLNIKQSVDSDVTPSFSIQTSIGGNALTLTAGTNTQLGIGLGSSTMPSLNANGIEVNGALRLTGGANTATIDEFVTPEGSVVDTKINIPIYNPGAFNQILALGLTSTSDNSARVISVFDARTTAHQPPIAIFSPDENQVMGLSWDGSNTTSYVKTSANTLTLQANGLNLLSATNSGGTAVLSTTGSFGANSINSTTGYKYNGTAGSSITCTSGDFLQDAVIQGGIVTGGTCAAASGGGGIQGSGTANTLAMFTSGGIIGDSIINQAGSNINVVGGLYVSNATYSYGVHSDNFYDYGSGSITMNDNVTVAAGKTIRLVGDTTAQRPASPSEGTIYFDTTTDELLVYAAGSWQPLNGGSGTGDGKTATKIVAASDSPQAIKDIADYVADGESGNGQTTLDGDQVEINQALTAAAGGYVYLAEGTYVADATILIPNNTTLAGAGQGTVIELADIDATDNLIENSETSPGTGVVIRDLKLDGRKDLNSGATQNGLYYNNMDYGRISNVTASNFDSTGIYLNSSDRVILSENFVSSNESRGIILTNTSINNTLSNNIVKSNRGGGISIAMNNNYNTVSGNLLEQNYDTGSSGIQISGNYNVFTDNFVEENAAYGVYVTGSNNTISNNTMRDNGGSTSNNAIYLSNASNNTIIGNSIYDSTATANWAIAIFNSTSNNNYLANNTLGAGIVNDLGTGTIYAGQQNSNGYFGFKASTTRLGLGNVSPAYTLDVSGDINTTTGYRINGTAGTDITCTSGDVLQDATISGGIVTGGSCVAAGGGGGGITTVGAIDGGTYSDNGASISGSTIYLQSASDTYAGLVNTTDQTFAGNKTFNGNVTVSGTTTLNDNVTVATGKTIRLVGDTTAQRPASPSEGTIYFDTTTDELLVYAAGSWQPLNGGSGTGDGKTATKIVAASDSPQAIKDIADYVADGEDSSGSGIGTLDGDQIEINQALTAAAGGYVYLAEGTYTIDASISVPNNTTISGSGNGTIIQFGNFGATSVSLAAIKNTDTTTGEGVVIRDLQINGRNTINTAGTQNGVQLVGVGTADGGASLKGGVVDNVKVSNILTTSFYFSDTNSTRITNTIASDSANAYYFTNSSHNYFANNSVHAPTNSGIWLQNQSSYNSIMNNTVDGSAYAGLQMDTDSSSNKVSGNTIYNNGGSGVWMSASSGNTISNNISSGNTYNGFYDYNSDGNVYSGNIATDNDVDGFTLYTTTNTLVSNNSTQNNGSYAFDIYDGSNNLTLSGNNSSGDSMAVYLYASNNVTVTGNNFSGNVWGAVLLEDADNNVISNNRITDSGDVEFNGAIWITWSNANKITENTITDASATNVNEAIIIEDDNDSVANYLSNNTLGGGSINDAGTGTIYAGQQDANGYFSFKASTTRLGIGNVSPAYMLDVSGDINTNTRYRINGTAGVSITCTSGDVLQDATIKGGIVTGGSCVAAGGGGGGGITTVGALDGVTYSANGATISGDTIYLQSANEFYAGLIATTTQTFAGSKTFKNNVTIGGSAFFNNNLTVSAGKTLRLMGGTTMQRPASPAEGTLYFDLDTQEMLVYANASWQVLNGGTGGGGGGGQTRRINLIPEYAGAILQADGSNNSGVMNADSVKGLSSGQGYKHNYYQWTASGTTAQDYDIVAQTQLPSEYVSGLSNLKIWGYSSNTTNATATIQFEDTDGTTCYASAVSFTPSTGSTWEQKTVGAMSGCAFAANDIVTITIHLVASNDAVFRVGEISFDYTN